MKIDVIQRHAVLDRESAESLYGVFYKTVKYADAHGHAQKIVLTYKPDLLDAGYLSVTESNMGRLGIEIKPIEWKKPNPGLVFIEALKMGDSDKKVILNSDDFDLCYENISMAIDFMDLALKNCPYWTGQRSHIRLSYYTDLNRKRQVHEMLLASFCGEAGILDSLINMSNSPPGYMKYGDRFSGFYAIDLGNEKAKQAVEEIKACDDERMKSTFAPEYILSLAMGKEGLQKFYCVPANPRNSGSKRPEEAISEMIRDSSTVLLKSELGAALLSHLKDKKTVSDLSEFYPKDTVESVRDLMLEGAS